MNLRDMHSALSALRRGGNSPDSVSSGGMPGASFIQQVPYALAKITGLQNAGGSPNLACYSYVLVAGRDPILDTDGDGIQRIVHEDAGAYRGNYASIDPAVTPGSKPSAEAFPPAYEVSGNLKVPTDGTAIVQLWPGKNHLWFEYHPVAKSPKILAAITAKVPTFVNLSSPYNTNYYLWQYSWTAVKTDGFSITNASSTDTAPFPNGGIAGIPVGAFQVGFGYANGVPSQLGATGGNVVMNIVRTVSGVLTTFSATITSSMSPAIMLSTLQGVGTAAGITVNGYALPVGGLFLSYTAAGGTTASLLLGSTTLTPSVSTNLAIESTGFSVQIGRIVELEKIADGPIPTVSVTTTAGNGSSTHTTFVATLNNTVGGSWEPQYDGVQKGSIDYQSTASSLQSALNAGFSPTVFTVSGSTGGPYTIVVTSDFKSHDFTGNADNLIDNGVYAFSASYLGPRFTTYPGELYAGAGTTYQDKDAEGRNSSAGTFSAGLFMIAQGGNVGSISSFGQDGDTWAIPVDGSCNFQPGGSPTLPYDSVSLPTDPTAKNGISLCFDGFGFPFLGLPGYQPGTSSDWTGPAPTTVASAIDRLAHFVNVLMNRVNALDGGGLSKP